MQNHVPCSCTMPRTMHMHNRLLPNPRIMLFPSNRRTTCRRSPALKKPWPKKLWVPTNETEIRIRLSGGNVESEETVATTRGGELWCGAGCQVGLRCPTSPRPIAHRRSPPSSPHFRPSARRSCPPLPHSPRPTPTVPVPALRPSSSPRLPCLCPSPIHADLAQLHPPPAPLTPLVAACCSPPYCPVYPAPLPIPAAAPRIPPIASLCPHLPLPATFPLPLVSPSPLLPVGSLPDRRPALPFPLPQPWFAPSAASSIPR